MFKSIRLQLLTIFLLFTLITTISSVIVFNYFVKSKDSISEITQQIETTYILLLKDIKITHDFFENESINPEFFKTKKSALLNSHRTICQQIEFSLAMINLSQQKNNFELNPEITKLKNDFRNYKILTNKIVKQILIRGFKDYGIEGEMRGYAHTLETYKKEMGLVNILQLRRHEKDYIIRQEDQYILKHKNLTSTIKNELLSNKGITRSNKIAMISALDNYSNLFQTLISYEKRIGLKTGQGLKKEIDSSASKIENTFISMISSASLKEQSALSDLKIVFVLIWIVLIAASVTAAILISKRVSRSIIALKEKITEFVKSDFTIRTILPLKDSENEVDILSTNFSIMEQHIVNQMNALKQTNKELEILFYSASHEIKSPLAQVNRAISMAKERIQDREANKYFEMIEQSWQNLSTVVDELGMVSDIKDEEIIPEEINFEKIIQTVFSEFRLMPKFNDIIFSLDINLNEKFYSSSRLIETIFRNLIENSIKYSTKREMFSFLKISMSMDKNNMLKIFVSDNGIGIRKEYHEKIFDMFFRGTTQLNGTGLGLFIVQNSLQKLNGAISVESDERIGTTFTILLPNKIKNNNMMERLVQKRDVYDSEDNLVLNYI